MTLKQAAVLTAWTLSALVAFMGYVYALYWAWQWWNFR